MQAIRDFVRRLFGLKATVPMGSHEDRRRSPVQARFHFEPGFDGGSWCLTPPSHIAAASHVPFAMVHVPRMLIGSDAVVLLDRLVEDFDFWHQPERMKRYAAMAQERAR